MVRNRLARIVGVAFLGLLGGCQTMASRKHADPPGAYSGVRRSFEIIEDNADSSHPRMMWPLAIAICVVDLPFSAVADTVILPYVLWEEWSAPPGSSAVERHHNVLGTGSYEDRISAGDKQPPSGSSSDP